MEKCKKCLALESSMWESDFIKKNGICENCYLGDKDLIKHGNHYVLWEYQNYCDVEGDVPLDLEDFEDANAILPTVSWCSRIKKWKIEFVAKIFTIVSTTPDNDPLSEAWDIVWYFDTKKDIISSMERIPHNKLIRKDNHYIFQESEGAEDVNKPLPRISLCPKHKKWKIEFTSKDEETGAVFNTVWYFDNKEDIIKSMEK